MSPSSFDPSPLDPAAHGLPLSDVRLLDPRHLDRPVYRATWCGTSSAGAPSGTPVVVKCFSGPAAAERAERLQLVTTSLWESTAGVMRPVPVAPRPIAWRVIDPATAVVVMESLDGEAIGRRGHLGRSVELAAACGALLADLHAARPTPAGDEAWSHLPRRPASRVLRSTRRKLDELSPDVAAAAAPLYRRMERHAGEIARRGERLVPTHGDAAPRNVLDTVAGVRLIDLDRVHLASAARDVAYWIAWAHATVVTGEPGQRTDDDFLAHYLRATAGHAAASRDTDPAHGVAAVCADLPFHLAAAVVRIVHGWSALQARPQVQRDLLVSAEELVGDTSRWAAADAARSTATVRPDADGADRCGGSIQVGTC